MIHKVKENISLNYESLYYTYGNKNCKIHEVKGNKKSKLWKFLYYALETIISNLILSLYHKERSKGMEIC